MYKVIVVSVFLFIVVVSMMYVIDEKDYVKNGVNKVRKAIASFLRKAADKVGG